VAEDENGQDRTEQPSGRRLDRAREEGRVPMGRDAGLVAGLGVSAVALLLLGGNIRAGLVRAVSTAVQELPGTNFALVRDLLWEPAWGVFGVCAAAAVAGAAATIAQTGGGLWPHLVLPDVSRLWGAGRLNLFRKDLWIDLGTSAVKVVALAWVAWKGVRADFLTLPAMLTASPAEQLAQAFRIAGRIGWRLLLVSLVIAGLDLALQRWRFTEKMKMTKEEARREIKEDEGDPAIKGKRKKRHRELSRGRAALEVPRADALLVNPTHIAIALRYRRDEGRAPRVTAKGKGELAEYMRDLARQNAIPIVEDIPLARLLFRKVKVGHEVPASTYKAVAAVLAFVYRITGKTPAQNGVRA
jgi:flagellar biosynthesis protein FlhB